MRVKNAFSKSESPQNDLTVFMKQRNLIFTYCIQDLDLVQDLEWHLDMPHL